MKTVRINLGKVGIVRRKGDYKRVLTAGKYWVRLSDQVTIFAMEGFYTMTAETEIMLQDEKFAALVEVMEVKDFEIALKSKGSNFERVVGPGRYFYFKGLVSFNFEIIDLRKAQEANQMELGLLNKHELAPYRTEVKIEAFEEGLLFIDGKFVRRLTKGLYFFWKCVVPVEVMKVDLRQVLLEISGQELLTKDKAALRLNFQATYRLVDAEKALLENKDYQKQLYTAFQLALREFVGTLTLDELLAAKEKVATAIFEQVKSEAKNLGVAVITAGIRDIILPGEVRDIMNKVLVAQKSAEANTIARREETAATRTLLNTAKLMEDNDMLYRLKEMEFIEKIANKVGEVNLSSNGQVLEQLTKVFSK
ncbi:MAG: slipin family protein [Fluviicola sp.]